MKSDNIEIIIEIGNGTKILPHNGFNREIY